MGILVPCLTVALSLFCVMTLGFERSLPTPLASAAVMKKSTAKLGERWPRNSPLVGAPAARLGVSGRLVVPTGVRKGGGGLVTTLGPTDESPHIIDRPVVCCPA